MGARYALEHDARTQPRELKLTDLPELRDDGHLPILYRQNNQYSGGASAWKVTRLNDALTIGIDKEIDDPHIGLIPANVPLDSRQAARALGLSLKTARKIQLEPAFKTAFSAAIEIVRACAEPKNLMIAAEIRDDPEQPVKSGFAP